MRGRQGETHCGSCWRSRAIMPYNSVATRMKISDSSVAQHPASRPHQKSTPPNPAEREFEHAREKNGYSRGACTQCIVVVEGWLLAGCIRRENSASRVAHGGRPILQAWAMVCGTAASPREGDAREAALLGWWDSRPGSRVRRRTSYAWSSFSSRNLVEAPNKACILLPRSAHAGVLLRTTGGSKNPYRVLRHQSKITC